MSTFDPAALECLAAIVEDGGFERAAQRLSITQSAVSQRLRALEAQVGTVLIVRSRPLRPTGRRPAAAQAHEAAAAAAGRPRARPARAGAQLGRRRAREEERISIAVNADSIATWALPALDALARQGLPLEIIADDQDFTHEWLREGQVLGCVTTRQAGAARLQGGAARRDALRRGGHARVSWRRRAAAGPDARTTSARCPSSPSTARTTCRRSSSARAFGLRRVGAAPAVRAELRRAGAGRAGGLGRQRGARAAGARAARAGPAGRRAARRTGCRSQLYWHCWNLQSAVLDALTGALQATAAEALGH